MPDAIGDPKPPRGLRWLGEEEPPAPVGDATEVRPLLRAANGLAALDAMIVNRSFARSSVAAPLRLAGDAAVAVGAVFVSAVVAVGAVVVVRGMRSISGMGSEGMDDAVADQ